MAAAPLVITSEAPIEITIPAGTWLLGKSDRLCESTLEIRGKDTDPVILPYTEGQLALLPIELSEREVLTVHPEIAFPRSSSGESVLTLIDASTLAESIAKDEQALLATFETADSTQLRERLVRSVALAERWAALPNQSTVAGSRWLMAASTAIRLQQFDNAERYARRAYECCDAEADPWLRGNAGNTLGLAMVRNSVFDDGESVLNDAAAKLGDYHADRAVNPAASNLCYSYFRQATFDRAEPCYQTLLETAEAVGDGQSAVRYLNLLGGIHSKKAEPRKALEYLDNAFSHPAAQERTALRALLARTRALELGRLGRFQEQLAMLQLSLEIFRELDDRPQMARTMNNMGIAYGRLGVYRQAADLLGSAYEISKSINPNVQLRVGLGLTTALSYLEDADRTAALARELSRLSENTRDASLRYRARLIEIRAARASGNLQAATTQTQALLTDLDRAGDAPRMLASTLILAGKLHLAQKDSDKARDHLERAVALGRASADDLQTAEALSALAAVKIQMLDSAGALQDALEAIELIEATRGDIQNLETRASYQSTVQSAYALVIDLHVRGGDADAALEMAERYRAQTLVDVLEKSSAAPPADAPTELLSKRADLRAEINRREEARVRGQSSEAIADLLSELDVLDAEIARYDPRYQATQRSFALDVATMQDTIDPGTLVLQFFLGAERSYAWLIGRDQLEVVTLPDRAALAALAVPVHEDLSRRGRGEDRLLTLGQVLLGPFAERLSEVARVSIVADGALNYIAFDALPVAAGDPPLLLGKALSFQPSLTALSLTRQRAQPSGDRIVVVADPVFQVNDERLPKPAATATDASALNRLRLSAREAATLKSLAPMRTEQFIGFDARADRLRTETLKSAAIVHLATHGFADDEVPARSGVMLSLFDASGTPQTGFVGLRDIYELRLGAELVTLSACDAALGRELAGEGLLGLTSGFMYAGAQRVVASLWPVSDRATAEFMAHFYEALLVGGLSPDSALAAAKVKLRTNRRYRHPYYWGAFVLYGDWRPIRHAE